MIEEKEIDFLLATVDVLEGKEPDLDYPFCCPICGGQAYARKIGYNGHRRAHCENCGIKIIE